jgi:sarcosine oxidase subunit gamma
MTTMHKISPVSYSEPITHAKMGTYNGMYVALEFEGDSIESERKSTLGVTDVSCFTRFGIKGPQAANWLASQGIQLPAEKNTWLQQSDCLVMRLGNSEFLLEDQCETNLTNKLTTLNQSITTGVYQVTRVDAAFLLSGSQVLNLLSELCMLDLRDSSFGTNELVMTQVAGISATILRQQLSHEQVYRIWCDGTYGAYLWEIFLEVAGELGGGAVGLSSHFQSLLRG